MNKSKIIIIVSLIILAMSLETIAFANDVEPSNEITAQEVEEENVVEAVVRTENFPWKPHRTFDWNIANDVLFGDIEGDVYASRLSLEALNGKGRISKLQLIYQAEEDVPAEMIDLHKVAVERDDHYEPKKGNVLLMYAGDFISFQLDPTRSISAIRITADSWINRKTDLDLKISIDRVPQSPVEIPQN